MGIGGLDEVIFSTRLEGEREQEPDRSAQIPSRLSIPGVLPIWRGSADISRRDPSSYRIGSHASEIPIFILEDMISTSSSPRSLSTWRLPANFRNARINFPLPTLFPARPSRPHRSKPRLRRLKLVDKLGQHSLLRMQLPHGRKRLNVSASEPSTHPFITGIRTHHVPEPKPAFHFHTRRPDPRECLLADLECHRLCLAHSFCIRVTYTLLIVQMRQRIQINLRQHTKPCVHFTLERQ